MNITLRRGIGEQGVVRTLGGGCVTKLISQLARKRQPRDAFLRLELEPGVNLLVEHKPYDVLWLSLESESGQVKLVARIEGEQRREIACFLTELRGHDRSKRIARQSKVFSVPVWVDDIKTSL